MMEVRVTLSDDLQAFVEERVAAGTHADASEVVANAVAALKRREEKMAKLREMVQLAIDQVERGEFVEFDEEKTLREIEEGGRALLEARRKGIGG